MIELYAKRQMQNAGIRIFQAFYDTACAHMQHNSTIRYSPKDGNQLLQPRPVAATPNHRQHQTVPRFKSSACRGAPYCSIPRQSPAGFGSNV